MDAIPVIDIRLLTQAEINALALSSSTSASSFLLDRSSGDDVIVPKIDRSVFNESAGSRKQTYSRLRLAPPKSTSSTSSSTPTTTTTTGRRRCRPRSVSAPSLTTAPSSVPDTSVSDAAADDRGRKENEQIVQFLRQLFAKNGHSEALAVSNVVPDSKTNVIPDSSPQTMPQSLISDHDGERRKRGRKKRRVVEEFGVGSNVVDESADREILNVNDVAVDVVLLGEKEEKLFKDEFVKRTVGLVTEAEFLGFLNGLEGQWGSRRKRRKVVDAGIFGEWLPKGWKLLLGLKRKDGAVWVYCRRYISPSGKQFVSCKEISRYLLSLIGHREVTPSVPVTKDEDTLVTGKPTAGTDAGFIVHQDINRKDMGSCFSGAPFSVCAEPDKSITVSNVVKSPNDCILNSPGNGGMDCIPSNSMTDCAFDISNSGADVKLSSYTNSDRLIDIKRSACLEVDPQVSCEQLKNIIPESALDSSSREIIWDQLNICSVIDKKPKELDESINPCPMLEFSTHLSRNDDKECSTHEMVSEGASFNVFVLENNVSGEDFGSTNKTSNIINNGDCNVASQTVCNSKYRNSEANNIDYTTMAHDEQNSRYEVSDENSRSAAITGSAAAFGVGCDIDGPGTTQEKSSIPGDNQIGSYDKMDKTMFSIGELCNNQIHSQLDVNDVMTERFSNSAEENVEKNDKLTASLDATDSSCYVENLTYETSTVQYLPSCSTINDTENRIAEHKVEADSSFVNLSNHCECSAEKSPFEYRQIDKIGSSLHEQKLYLGSHLNSLPASVASYSVRTSANSVLGSSLENVVLSSGNDQACDLECRMDDVQLSSVEESLACQASDHCKELENDTGVGFFGSNNNSACNNVEEGSELDERLAHTPSLWLQPSNTLTTESMISNQVMNKSHERQQDVYPSSGLGEQLKLDSFGITDTVQLAYRSSELRPEVTMGLSYSNGGLDQVFAPVRLGLEMSAPDMVGKDQHQVATTVCMWCGIDFYQEGINHHQLQSDTVGFICPTCKSKISGQLKF